MPPEFEIVADPHRDMLRISLSGFLGLRDVAVFARRLRVVQVEVRCPPGAHVTLIDVRGCKIQPQPVARALARLIGGAGWRARRTAFVTGGSPASMQVRRLIGGVADMRLFADPVLAEAWLLAFRAEAA